MTGAISTERHAAPLPLAAIVVSMRGRKPKDPSRPAPNRLREWREHRGLSRAAVAELMQSKAVTVAKHETGGNEMSVATFLRYAKIYDVRFEDLLASSRVSPSLQALIDIGVKLPPNDLAKLVRASRGFFEQHESFTVKETPPAHQRRGRRHA